MTAEEMQQSIEEVNSLSAFVPVTVAERLSWDDFSKVALKRPRPARRGARGRYVPPLPASTPISPTSSATSAGFREDLEGLENPDPLLKIPKFQIGKIGSRSGWKDTLRGHAGTKRIEVNSAGRVMRELERQEGEPGLDIRLTIDADVPELRTGAAWHRSAAVVVVDVTNRRHHLHCLGPSFDPNLFVRGISHADYKVLMENDHRPLANKTVLGRLSPGVDLQDGQPPLPRWRPGSSRRQPRSAAPATSNSAGGGSTAGSARATAPCGWSAASRKAATSISTRSRRRSAIDKIAEMGRKLGLGQRFDIPMSAITEGNMPDKAWKLERHKQDWRIGDTINASIGQGYVLTSPLQLAVMTARIASGRAVSPRLVRMVNDKELPTADAPALDIPPEYLAAVRKGMHEVVNGEHGTAKSSRIVEPTMVFAGKTGTSQVRNISKAEREAGVISNDDLPWNRRDHALFVGFAPYDAPRYAVAVVVEHGGGGSTAAAPIARDVILRALYGEMPSLDAYPSSQRGRIETMLKELPLRDPRHRASARADRNLRGQRMSFLEYASSLPPRASARSST